MMFVVVNVEVFFGIITNIVISNSRMLFRIGFVFKLLFRVNIFSRNVLRLIMTRSSVFLVN